MKKYFLNDGTSQQGPFDLEELRSRNITAQTPIWYEGLAEWTTAGKVEELRDIYSPVVTPVVPAPIAEEVTPVIPPVTTVEPAPVVEVTTVTTPPVVTTTTVEKTTTTTATAVKPVVPVTPRKNSTAWISYLLGLLALAAIGYLIYKDMEKNKTASSSTTQTAPADSTASTAVSTTTVSTPDTATSVTDPVPDTTTTTDPTTTTVTEPVTTTTVTTANTASTDPNVAKKAAAKKAEEEKKKKLAVAQKKAEEDKKKADAAKAAAAAKEMEMRNNWSKYITFGKLNYDSKGDGVSAFDVPVYNSTDAVIDKVTIRVDYMKKDKKVVKSETIVIYRIPPRSGLNGKAPESKKGDRANVYITGISSRQLHFCYPQNNGNAGDPYFCN